MTRSSSPAIAVAGILSIALAAVAAGCGDSNGTTPTTPTPTVQLPAMSVMLAEKSIGSAAAPVTMLAYSSLTCSHCGDFHTTTLPLLKSSYIDTGRVRFVFRDFSRSDADTAASMVARCSGDGFFTTIDALFRAQTAWAYSTNYTAAIKTVVAPLGITAATVDACVASTELRTGVLAIRDAGVGTYAITGTPTFIINGRKVVPEGAQPYAVFASIIDSF